jgi:predicted lactoylglutathione lyase
MIKDVWINLPVKDLAKSVLFHEGIGLVRKWHSMPSGRDS